MTLMKLSACGSACILTVLWAVGAAGLTLFFLLGYLRTLRALSGARQAPDAGIWLSSCGIRFHRTISIRLLDDARTPLTYGLGRPVVVLPEHLETDARRRMYILTHELVHIRSARLSAKVAADIGALRPLVQSAGLADGLHGKPRSGACLRRNRSSPARRWQPESLRWRAAGICGAEAVGSGVCQRLWPDCCRGKDPSYYEIQKDFLLYLTDYRADADTELYRVCDAGTGAKRGAIPCCICGADTECCCREARTGEVDSCRRLGLCANGRFRRRSAGCGLDVAVRESQRKGSDGLWLAEKPEHRENRNALWHRFRCRDRHAGPRHPRRKRQLRGLHAGWRLSGHC